MNLISEKIIQKIIEDTKLSEGLKKELTKELLTHFVEEEKELSLQGYKEKKILEIIRSRFGDIKRIQNELTTIHTMNKDLKKLLISALSGFILLISIFFALYFYVDTTRIRIDHSSDEVIKRMEREVSKKRFISKSPELFIFSEGEDDKWRNFMQEKQIVFRYHYSSTHPYEAWRIDPPSKVDMSKDVGWIIDKTEGEKKRIAVPNIENKLFVLFYGYIDAEFPAVEVVYINKEDKVSDILK